MGWGLNSLAVCLFWWMNDKRCKILWFWRDFMSFKEAVLAAASRWAVYDAVWMIVLMYKPRVEASCI